MEPSDRRAENDTHGPGRPAKSPPAAVILAVETSSRIGSAALAVGPTLLEESQFSAPMQHSAEIFPAIDRLLKNHGRTPDQIDQVYLAVGPGSFTGLRIAVALAKTMHLATGVKIVTVGSLDVVVANLSDLPTGQFDTQEGPTALPERVAALFDAKRGQFYAATYQHLGSESEAPPATDAEDPGYRISASDIGLWRKSSPDRLMTAPEIVGNSPGLGGLGLLGDGLLYQRDKFATDRVVILPERFWGPRAANVHRLGYQKAQAGLFSDPLALIPRYLRGPEVTLRKGS